MQTRSPRALFVSVPTAIPNAPCRRPLLLLVESDEQDVLLFRTACNLLSDVQVTALPDETEAFAYLRGEAEYAQRARFPLPQVLVCDSGRQMPVAEMLVAWLKTDPQLRDIPCFVWAADAAWANRERFERLGARACYPKPDYFEEVKAMVCDVLERAGCSLRA
jgi:CheY-like chemotaxis protein